MSFLSAISRRLLTHSDLEVREREIGPAAMRKPSLAPETVRSALRGMSESTLVLGGGWMERMDSVIAPILQYGGPGLRDYGISPAADGYYFIYDSACFTGQRYNGPDLVRGTIICPDGSRYDGQWRKGSPHGQGTIICPDGGRYDGQWRKGSPHGQGTIIYPNGKRYNGQWRKGRIEGQGEYVWPSGASYKGELLANCRHGRGKYTRSDGSTYEGEWFENRRHGQGKCTGPDGSTYEGGWSKNCRHGLGCETSSTSPSPHQVRWDRGRKLDEQEGRGGDPVVSIPRAGHAIILQSTYDWNGSFQEGGVLKHPATILDEAGWSTHTIQFGSLRGLQKQLEGLAGRVDLVWVQAHGSPFTMHCGPQEEAKPADFRSVWRLFDSRAVVVIEACQSGQRGGFAEGVASILCSFGQNAAVIAPVDTASHRGIDEELLKRGELSLLWADADGIDVTTVFKCP